MADDNTELFNQSFDSITDEGIDLAEIQKSDDATLTTEGSTEGEGIEPPVAGDRDIEKSAPENIQSTETPPAPVPDPGLDLGDINADTGGMPGETGGTSEGNDGPGTGGDSSPVTPFASLLQEKGFLPHLNMEDFNKADNKIEALMQAMGNEIGMANQRFIQSFPPELMNAAKAVSEGVPYSALEGSVLKDIEYNSVTDDQLNTDEALQKRLVSDLLTTKGFKEAKIKGLVDTYEDSGKLKGEAEEALAELKTLAKQYQEQVKQQYAQQQENFNQRHQEKLHQIQEVITGADYIIPGKKLGQADKDRLYQNMTQIVGQDDQGNPMPYTMSLRQQNPLKFDLMVTYLADVTKGFSDFTSINASAKSKVLKDLESSLDSNTAHTSGSPKKAPGAPTESALMSSLETMFGPKK